MNRGSTSRRFAIELRNGSYLANLDADKGVPLNLAMRFETREAAERLMSDNQWICFYGGMVVEVKS